MNKLANNDRAIKGCRPRAGQSRTRWTVDGRKGLYVDVSAKPSAPADDAARTRDDFRRTYYYRDQRHGIFERLDDVDLISLSEAWQAVQQRHAQATIHGPRSTHTATFGQLFDAWLEQAKKRPLKSWPAEEAMYVRHLKDRLATRIVAEQRKRDFIAVRDQIAKAATPLQADKAIALAARVLNWAEKTDLIEEHSAKDIPPLTEPPERDRVFNHDELRKLWSAFEGEASFRVAVVLRLLLLSGLRLSEIAGMRRSELKADNARGNHWEIPPERTKSGLAHVVPITDTMRSLLNAAIKAAEESPFVFPAMKHARVMGKPMSRHTPDHAFAQIASDVGLLDLAGKPDCSVHDLRRTFATELARLGYDDAMIDRLQGRVRRSRGAIRVYNRYDYFSEKRAALERWETELLRMVQR